MEGLCSSHPEIYSVPSCMADTRARPLCRRLWEAGTPLTGVLWSSPEAPAEQPILDMMPCACPITNAMSVSDLVPEQSMIGTGCIPEAGKAHG